MVKQGRKPKQELNIPGPKQTERIKKLMGLPSMETAPKSVYKPIDELIHKIEQNHPEFLKWLTNPFTAHILNTLWAFREYDKDIIVNKDIDHELTQFYRGRVSAFNYVEDLYNLIKNKKRFLREIPY